MSRRLNWARRMVPPTALILVLSLAACGRDGRRHAPESPAAVLGKQPQAQVAINISGLSTPNASNDGRVPGFHVNAASLQLRIEAADVPGYTVQLPVTTFDNVVKAPVGADRLFHLEVENHWGLAIYQSEPQIADLIAGEKLEISFDLTPIETILPLAATSALPNRSIALVVEEEDSPLQDLRLTIPNDAISKPLWVSIDEVYHAAHLPAPVRQASVIIDIQPHNVRLTSPATLTLPYYQSLVSRLNLPESHLRISYFNPSKQQWQPLARQTIQTDENRATAQLDQFGWFVLTIGEEPLPALLATEDESPPAPEQPESPQVQETSEMVEDDVVAASTEDPATTQRVASLDVDEATERIAPSPPAVPMVWSNDRVTLRIRPQQRGTIGMMLRYQDARSHYRFVWDLTRQQAHFVKHFQGQRAVLKSVSLPYVASQTYPLHIVTQSDAITVSVGDSLVFYIRDSDIPSGTVALNCASDTSQCFDQVQID